MFKTTCIKCKMEHTFDIPVEDIIKWQNGMLIQDAMPYLDKDARELLISGVCGECFTNMFKDEE